MLTVVLKVTAFCHARAFFVRFFFSALVFMLLWMGKRCDLCLIPMRFHFYLFSPWTEKRLIAVLKATTLCWICSLFLRIFVILYFPRTLLFSGRLKVSFLSSTTNLFQAHYCSYFFPKPNQFFCLIFCGRFLGQFVMLL
ncbi:hypothetical protein GLYMA_06G236600v4 [Glycine max]|uniref:Uncharacterized protein n=1 Tax=Glycine max TaxID=3847 RepID=A0A0R0JL28_SOYBN|nr:hypothetical protein GYH30_016059 [Glycine max]KRH55197.1 hypothetical protein GLYMA_06G236600v4 [Glycine max]